MPARPEDLLTLVCARCSASVLQGSTDLVTTSEVMTLTTQPIALPVVLVLFFVALIAGAVGALVVVFFVVRYVHGGLYPFFFYC